MWADPSKGRSQKQMRDQNTHTHSYLPVYSLLYVIGDSGFIQTAASDFLDLCRIPQALPDCRGDFRKHLALPGMSVIADIYQTLPLPIIVSAIAKQQKNKSV